jgi:HD-GYP domain-containing protein (c-di-GMP phosphodiesterase class II)
MTEQKQIEWQRQVIRDALQYRHTSSLYEAEFHANVDEWLRFLLSELERKEEENRKLREELEYAKTSANVQRRTAVQSLQILQNDREKLIEGLREIAYQKFLTGSTAIQMKSKARDILIEIGVNVDD